MKRIKVVEGFEKGTIVLCIETCKIWNSEIEKDENICREYTFEVIHNYKVNLHCTFLSGVYKGAKFIWKKGHVLDSTSIKYYLIEDEREIAERCYVVD